MKRRYILLFLGLAILGCLGTPRHIQAQLPPSKGAPKVGDKAPDFMLSDSTGKPVRVSELRSGTPTVDGASAEIPGRWLLLVFYRGYW